MDLGTSPNTDARVVVATARTIRRETGMPTTLTPSETRLRQPDVVAPSIVVRDVSRRFGARHALKGVSLQIVPGTVHALLGPNGAGKTTLLRILTGLLKPGAGEVSILGEELGSRTLQSRIGFIPAGDRSFYLRISGRENLAFFARLHGIGRRDAFERADRALTSVGLGDAARLRVGAYSHGMQKRLSIARALLTEPEVLLVDEATHDLDPRGALIVRELVTELASRGAAVLWTTQRLDEIRGFADRVTLLREGETCFSGTVPELMAYAIPRRYLLRIRNGTPNSPMLGAKLQEALGARGTIAPDGGAEHFVLALADDAVLGDAIASLTHRDVDVLACREERSEIEEAFLHLTRSGPA
jgi:ABC-2 type transport system ATP-binding protein